MFGIQDLMDVLVPCIKWIPCLWGRILRSFTQTVVVDLPLEIIMDIFSRLPAELVFQCCLPSCTLWSLKSSQYFVNLHWNRAKSVIVLLGYPIPGTIYKCEVPLYFIDGRKKKIVPKIMPISFRYRHWSKFTLFDSYEGWLLFDTGHIFLMWNPATEKRFILKRPDFGILCGFFFDQRTRGYKVIFSHAISLGFVFEIYSLGTMSSSRTAKFSYAPRIRPPVILNGALHWLVNDRLYKEATFRHLKCSESIVLFDTDTEEIRTMALPRGKYVCGMETGYVDLLKMCDFMCFCDVTSDKYMDIWVLEDYAEIIWVKKYTINLEFLGPGLGSKENGYSIMKIDQDELFVRRREALYCYNMKMNVSRKTMLQHLPLDFFSLVLHTNSLFSLQADEIA